MTVEGLSALLAELRTADYSDPDVRRRRSAATADAVALANRLAEADDYDHDVYISVYDMVMELDRLG